jgi:prepilin-type N-terminal cleavage/methylation domain-containing protein
MTTARIRRDAGFSLVETIVAIAIFSAAAVPVLCVAAGAQRLARAQPEMTDLQQRMRVVAGKIQRDVAMAGAGPAQGTIAGLTGYMPAIVPSRLGLRSADPELTAFADRLTVFYAGDDAWQASVSADQPTQSAVLQVNPADLGCPAAGLCGFTGGMRALIIDTSGTGVGHELFTVTDVAAGVAHASPNPPFSRTYRAGAAIVPVVQHVYYFDQPGRRLMLYDGYQSDMPLIDDVVDFRVAYFVDASATSVPPPDAAHTSCLYSGGPPAVSRLVHFGDSGLQPVTAAQLTDGPICGISPNRFDGDLLRVRLVRITLRLDAAADDVRGQGSLFARPGRSTSAYSLVPDYEVTFDVMPRNLQSGGGPR